MKKLTKVVLVLLLTSVCQFKGCFFFGFFANTVAFMTLLSSSVKASSSW